MAEVRKKERQEKYNIDEIMSKTKKDTKKIEKKDKNNIKNTKNTKNVKEEKRSLWVRFRIFCHGVKTEFKKVHWPSKSDMIRYSVATIFFVVFCSLFFYLIDVIFALIQSILK